MIRDLFDNSIMAYRTGTEQFIRLVLETIRQARKKEAVAAELQLHSDQGFQYTSIAFYSIWRFRLYTKLSARPRVHLAADAPIPRFH